MRASRLLWLAKVVCQMCVACGLSSAKVFNCMSRTKAAISLEALISPVSGPIVCDATRTVMGSRHPLLHSAAIGVEW